MGHQIGSFQGNGPSTIDSIRGSWLVQPVGSTDSTIPGPCLALQIWFMMLRNCTTLSGPCPISHGSFPSGGIGFSKPFRMVSLRRNCCWVACYQSFIELPYHSMVNRNLKDLHIHLVHHIFIWFINHPGPWPQTPWCWTVMECVGDKLLNGSLRHSSWIVGSCEEHTMGVGGYKACFWCIDKRCPIRYD